MNKFIKKTALSILLISLVSCAGKDQRKDTSDLYEKSQTRQMIIERSGTQVGRGMDQEDRDLQLKDAENRLRTGGGLFGKKGGLDFGKMNDENVVASVGLPINPYLWRSSLETIEFMPLVSADAFAGTIITDWYTTKNNTKERCKVNIFIKGAELKTDNLKVNTFCQSLSNANNWVDEGMMPETNAKLENAILNKAKKIKISQN